MLLYDLDLVGKSALQKQIIKALHRITNFIENKCISEFKTIGYMDDCIKMTNGKDFVHLHKNGYMYIAFLGTDSFILYCFDIRNNKVLFRDVFDFFIKTNFPSVRLNDLEFSDITKKVSQDLRDEYKRLYISLEGVWQIAKIQKLIWKNTI